jgi:hypothetical protein
MAANTNRSGYGVKTVLAVGFGATCLAFLDNAKLMRGVADYAGNRMPSYFPLKCWRLRTSIALAAFLVMMYSVTNIAERLKVAHRRSPSRKTSILGL